MNRSLPLLLALALAAGGCSSRSASTPVAPKSIAAVPAGTLETAWGPLPTYRAEGGAFPFVLDPKRIPPPPAEVRPHDAVVLDLLVDRDGSIRDVKVQTSSGFEIVDRYAMNQYVGARSLLQVPPAAAPYVIRQTFVVGGDRSHATGFVNENNHYTEIRPMGTGARHPADH